MTNIDLLLEPLEDPQVKSAQPDAALLRSAFGKNNRIIVGQPVVNRIKPSEFGYSSEQIQLEQSRGFELVSVVTSVSFVPDSGCRFIAADLTLTFSSGKDSTESTVRPIVCELKPREVVRKQTYKELHEMKAKMSAEFAKLLGAQLDERIQSETEGTEIFKDIYGFGLNYHEAGWHFQAGLGFPLTGIVHDALYFVVKKPSRATLLAELKVGAEIAVESAIDRWATIAFGLARKSNALGHSFDLSSELTESDGQRPQNC